MYGIGFGIGLIILRLWLELESESELGMIRSNRRVFLIELWFRADRAEKRSEAVE